MSGSAHRGRQLTTKFKSRRPIKTSCDDSTNENVKYDRVCQLRAKKVMAEYETVYKEAVAQLALQQPTAFAGVRLERVFTNGIIIPRRHDASHIRRRVMLDRLFNQSQPVHLQWV
ncbi:uncharacterized protein LOC111047029 [Nilaparvata lugens]|uniref:uncharacterized protein LOC111047029 n=1 Tax=Nilaparvata lugens TaxID=108931 RepID=UPI00193D308C|nr:uncharacterized protein LOC111047029 [Nilaparvata lugens]